MMKIALFDIDNTIISTDSFVDFVKYMIKQDKSNRKKLPIFLIYSVSYMLKIIKAKQFKTKILNLFFAQHHNIEATSKQFVLEKVIPNIKDGFTNTLKELRKDGFTIVFATASFEFYLKHLADFLRADIFVGTRAVLNKDKACYEYIGENCKGDEKINRLLNLFDEKDIDKANSVSYSDSLTDLPFLKLTDKFYLVDRIEWKILKVISKENTGSKT